MINYSNIEIWLLRAGAILSFLWTGIQVWRYFSKRPIIHLEINGISIKRQSDRDFIYYNLTIINDGEETAVVRVMFGIHPRNTHKYSLREAHKWMNIASHNATNIKGSVGFLHEHFRLEFPLELTITVEGHKRTYNRQIEIIREDGSMVGIVGKRYIM